MSSGVSMAEQLKYKQDMLRENPNATGAMLLPTLYTAETLEIMRQRAVITSFLPTPFGSFLDTKSVDFVIVTPDETAVLMQVTSGTRRGTERRSHIRAIHFGGLKPLIFVLQIFNNKHELITQDKAFTRIEEGIRLVTHVPLREG